MPRVACASVHSDMERDRGQAGGPLREAFTWNVSADDRGALRARQVTTEFLRERISARALGDVLLAVTELVSNALRHGLPPVQLAVTTTTNSVTIAVRDASEDSPHRAMSPTVDGGFGLRIVSAVCEQWGTDLGPAGKSVWCRISTEPAS